MPDLGFTVESAEVVPFAAAPLLIFKLRVVDTPLRTSAATPVLEEIASISLQCQIQIEARKRRYAPVEQYGLEDLFGAPPRWGETLHTLLWTHTSALAPAFVGECTLDLPVPCSYDFNLAATHYFHGLEEGEIPLMLQFSGTVFYREDGGALQAAPIPAHTEVEFRLPVALWRDMMARYYPNGTWLCLHRDVLDRLSRFKTRRGLTSWEQAVTSLLDGLEEDIS